MEQILKARYKHPLIIFYASHHQDLHQNGHFHLMDR